MLLGTFSSFLSIVFILAFRLFSFFDCNPRVFSHGSNLDVFVISYCTVALLGCTVWLFSIVLVPFLFPSLLPSLLLHCLYFAFCPNLDFHSLSHSRLHWFYCVECFLVLVLIWICHAFSNLVHPMQFSFSFCTYYVIFHSAGEAGFDTLAKLEGRPV